MPETSFHILLARQSEREVAGVAGKIGAAMTRAVIDDEMREAQAGAVARPQRETSAEPSPGIQQLRREPDEFVLARPALGISVHVMTRGRRL